MCENLCEFWGEQIRPRNHEFYRVFDARFFHQQIHTICHTFFHAPFSGRLGANLGRGAGRAGACLLNSIGCMGCWLPRSSCMMEPAEGRVGPWASLGEGWWRKPEGVRILTGKMKGPPPQLELQITILQLFGLSLGWLHVHCISFEALLGALMELMLKPRHSAQNEPHFGILLHPL
jgi:hypothetical protein